MYVLFEEKFQNAISRILFVPKRASVNLINDLYAIQISIYINNTFCLLHVPDRIIWGRDVDFIKLKFKEILNTFENECLIMMMCICIS